MRRHPHQPRDFLGIFVLKNMPQRLDLRGREETDVIVRVTLHAPPHRASGVEIKLGRQVIHLFVTPIVTLQRRRKAPWLQIRRAFVRRDHSKIFGPERAHPHARVQPHPVTRSRFLDMPALARGRTAARLDHGRDHPTAGRSGGGSTPIRQPAKSYAIYDPPALAVAQRLTPPLSLRGGGCFRGRCDRAVR